MIFSHGEELDSRGVKFQKEHGHGRCAVGKESGIAEE